MVGESVQALRRVYLNLGLGEIVAAMVFCGAMTWSVVPRLGSGSDRLALWAALVPLVVILVQAGSYWLAARSWIRRGQMPRGLRILYRYLRGGDAVLLAASLVVIIAARPSSAEVLVLALAVWLFGVIEYVNYFFVRLAYPARRWRQEVSRWRTSRLAKDLDSAGSTART